MNAEHDHAPATDQPERSAIERAVEICGSQSELARRIGGAVRQAHVWNWMNVPGAQVPAEHCRTIEGATAGAVTRYELRPDVFGPAPEFCAACGAGIGVLRREGEGTCAECNPTIAAANDAAASADAPAVQR